MANNWPDGGEQPLTTGEKLVTGYIAAALIAFMIACALFLGLAMIGPQPSLAMTAVAAVVGLALGLFWVRPWETEGPRRR